ncbi:MAG: AbrB/MazE/SpoVT family DNA-binding domain-containing protein [bacterium]|nr:AbrB/MazE/SpoVT family DNA-binding domain-containing protein [bacterium]
MTSVVGIEMRVDERGRVVIPRDFRGVKPGDEFLVSMGEGYIALTKVSGEPEERFALIKEVDGQHRISLWSVRKSIHLKPRGRAVVVSGGDHLQIWTRNGWRRHLKLSRP